LGACATIQSAFEGFQSIDLPFGLAVTPALPRGRRRQCSFDVWDSELPRLEIYGTKGTICIRDIDPVDGPNLFGGAVLVCDIDNYRWKGLPRLSRLARNSGRASLQ